MRMRHPDQPEPLHTILVKANRFRKIVRMNEAAGTTGFGNRQTMNEKVPIITGNFAPLRFVLLNKQDVWAPTFDQVVRREYDYVKMHRISTWFDVGMGPYTLAMCFDGTLVLPALQKFKDKDLALAQFNATLTEILIGGVYCEAVTPEDIAYGSLTHTGYARIYGSQRGPSLSFHLAARTKCIGPLDTMRLLNPATITVEELHKSLRFGRELLGKLGEIPREQVLYGTTFYVKNQWAESLIHMWTTTERIIELAWERYVVHASKDVSKRRRAFLDDHRSWPVSSKLEVLFQKNLLPLNTYEMLDDARKARNEFAHKGIAPSQDHASKALSACFELASLCASGFERTDLFEKIVSLVKGRCETDILPKSPKPDLSDCEAWMAIPPIPGDENWGDRECEIIKEICLQPIPEQLRSR